MKHANEECRRQDRRAHFVHQRQLDLSGDRAPGAVANARLRMHTISKFAIAVVLTFAVFTAFGQGQEQAKQQTKATADVPFEFLTLDTRFPAGQYSVSKIGPTHFFIRNDRERIGAEVFTMPDEKIGAQDKTGRLIFVEREGKTYLVGLVGPDGPQRVTGLYGVTLKAGDVRKDIAFKTR